MVGHSSGGLVAQRLAPDATGHADGLVLAGSPTHMGGNPAAFEFRG